VKEYYCTSDRKMEVKRYWVDRIYEPNPPMPDDTPGLMVKAADFDAITANLREQVRNNEDMSDLLLASQAELEETRRERDALDAESVTLGELMADLNDSNNKLRAERDRLREALQEIKELTGLYEKPVALIGDIYRLAKAALSGEAK